MVLVCLSSLAVLSSTTDAERNLTAVGQLLEAGKVKSDQVAAFTQHRQLFSGVAVCLATVIGTLWSAFVIWGMGRVLFKSRFEFRKALEVAGLAGSVLVLGTIVTGLLALAAGDASVRPALSALCLKMAPDSPLRAAAGVIDLFQLWTTGVLTIGLSRLAQVSIKESAFWVLGYWVVARIAFIILA